MQPQLLPSVHPPGEPDVRVSSSRWIPGRHGSVWDHRDPPGFLFAQLGHRWLFLLPCFPPSLTSLLHLHSLPLKRSLSPFLLAILLPPSVPGFLLSAVQGPLHIIISKPKEGKRMNQVLPSKTFPSFCLWETTSWNTALEVQELNYIC